MQVYSNILVTVDCSPVDDSIIRHISLVARQNSAKVHLLHVVHSHTLDQDRVLRIRCEGAMNAYRDQLQADGIETRLVVRSGEPEAQILAEIDEHAYDLVAMATHGHSLIGSMLFGSVSRSLKQKITIPMLIISGGSTG